MDFEPRTDGTLHVRITPLGKLGISLLCAGVVGMIGWAWSTGNAQLADLGKSVNKLSEQQAVTNTRLDTLTMQLADVPGLTRQLAELQVQVARNSQDIHELQADRRRR
jgi:hypothetical protein